MRPQKRHRNPSSKAAISTASTPKKAKSSKRPEKPSETGHAEPQHDVVPRNTFQRIEDEPSTHRTLQTGNPHQSNGSSGGNDQQSGPIMEAQIEPRGPETHSVIPATDERPSPINHGSNYQQNVNRVGVVFGLLDRPLCTGLEEVSFPGQGRWILAYRLQAVAFLGLVRGG
jgi:hypothetical protein